jgi:hypothetical protein
MEVQVLHGSAQTIRRCRPILFVEHLKSDRDSVRDTIANLDYVVYQRSMNFLGIPKELGGKIRIPVNSPEK